MKTNSIVLLKSVKYVTEELKPTHPMEASATDRQEAIPGYDQSTFGKSTGFMVGCGGLGNLIVGGETRKGMGTIKICDGDSIELSNLSRQINFYKEDLYKNKAICLGKNLRKEATKKTTIISYPMMFEEVVENRLDTSCDIAIIGVDNNSTRVFASRYFYEKGVPVVFTAVSRDGNNGYCFVQEPKKACFGCAFPNAINDNRTPCPNAPAILNILEVASGIVLFAVDTILMDIKRNWNYMTFYLNGFAPDGAPYEYVERKKGCPICSKYR